MIAVAIAMQNSTMAEVRMIALLMSGLSFLNYADQRNSATLYRIAPSRGHSYTRFSLSVVDQRLAVELYVAENCPANAASEERSGFPSASR